MSGRTVLLLLLTLLGSMIASAEARAQTLEDSVKANYLIRFAAFVDWPPDAFASDKAPVSVCIAGRDPFGAALMRAASGQTAHGRSLVVRRLTAGLSPGDCHILYLGDGAAPVGAVDQPLLVITDERRSAQRGMIHFVVVDGRVRFHIDAASATRSRLTMNSRLLALALSVRTR